MQENNSSIPFTFFFLFSSLSFFFALSFSGAKTLLKSVPTSQLSDSRSRISSGIATRSEGVRGQILICWKEHEISFPDYI
jgi:hypothetical protein